MTSIIKLKKYLFVKIERPTSKYGYYQTNIC